MKTKENLEHENISNEDPALESSATTSSENEQSGEDLVEDLDEDPEEEEEEEDPEEELEDPEEEDPEEEQEDPEEEDPEEDQEDPEEEDPDEIVEEDSGTESEEDPSEEDMDEDPSKQDPDEYVSQLKSTSDDNHRYTQVLKPDLSFHSSDHKAPLGESGKQRRSRWEPQLEQNERSSQKRRKTRWDISENLAHINNTLQATPPHHQRHRKQLVSARQTITAKLRKKNENPTTNKPENFSKKLYIPAKEFPNYNFLGLILGPKGNTIKQMEKETGAKILLRGKGSSKNKADSPDDDDLHVYITANSENSLDSAVVMVEKLLVPVDDHVNKHKLAQLKELARLRANHLEENNTCTVCWEKGHQAYACPRQPSTFKDPIPPQKPKKEIDNSNLYVGCLPKIFDEGRLREMFSPFGKIAKAIVMRDKVSGASKGYGFVKFGNSSDAAAAVVHMNKCQIDGRVLAVRVAGTEPPVAVLPPLAPFPSSPASGPIYPWPGQPSSTYYGHLSQYPSVGSRNITPPTGPRESKAESDLPANFPGNPDYPGSEFKSYFQY